MKKLKRENSQAFSSTFNKDWWYLDSNSNNILESQVFLKKWRIQNMGVVSGRASKDAKNEFFPYFLEVEYGCEYFFFQIFLNILNNNRMDFENTEFRNFNMWAWPIIGQFVCNFFENYRFSKGLLARLWVPCT